MVYISLFIVLFMFIVLSYTYKFGYYSAKLDYAQLELDLLEVQLSAKQTEDRVISLELLIAEQEKLSNQQPSEFQIGSNIKD